MHLTTAKVGGGSLKTADSIKRLVNLILEEEYNILIASAFSGMTNILEDIVRSRQSENFSKLFMSFHKGLAKSLRLKEIDVFFGEQSIRFDLEFARLMATEKNSFEESRSMAEIISMGEDFAQRIIYEFARPKLASTLTTLELVDSRGVVVTKAGNYLNARFDQKETTERVLEVFTTDSYVYIMQGFVAGTKAKNGETETVLLGREGSDVTAALICACLRNLPKPRSTSLVYLKTFGDDSLHGEIEIGKLFRYMKKTGKTVVSTNILKVKNLAEYFAVVDFHNPAKHLIVSADPLVVKRLLGNLPVD